MLVHIYNAKHIGPEEKYDYLHFSADEYDFQDIEKMFVPVKKYNRCGYPYTAYSYNNHLYYSFKYACTMELEAFLATLQ